MIDSNCPLNKGHPSQKSTLPSSSLSKMTLYNLQSDLSELKIVLNSFFSFPIAVNALNDDISKQLKVLCLKYQTLTQQFSGKVSNLQIALMNFEYMRENQNNRLIKQINQKDDLILNLQRQLEDKNYDSKLSQNRKLKQKLFDEEFQAYLTYKFETVAQLNFDKNTRYEMVDRQRILQNKTKNMLARQRYIKHKTVNEILKSKTDQRSVRKTIQNYEVQYNAEFINKQENISKSATKNSSNILLSKQYKQSFTAAKTPKSSYSSSNSQLTKSAVYTSPEAKAYQLKEQQTPELISTFLSTLRTF